MIPFPFISFFVETIIEGFRFILRMVQSIRISDLLSSEQALKPIEFLRELPALLILSILFPSK